MSIDADNHPPCAIPEHGQHHQRTEPAGIGCPYGDDHLILVGHAKPASARGVCVCR